MCKLGFNIHLHATILQGWWNIFCVPKWNQDWKNLQWNECQRNEMANIWRWHFQMQFLELNFLISSKRWLKYVPRDFILSTSYAVLWLFSTKFDAFTALQWRHYQRDGISNHQPHHCLLNTDHRKIKALCHWPLWGEFTGDRWIPRTKDQ